ncbi:hypothetical protein [Lactovum odontotermitis]
MVLAHKGNPKDINDKYVQENIAHTRHILDITVIDEYLHEKRVLADEQFLMYFDAVYPEIVKNYPQVLIKALNEVLDNLNSDEIFFWENCRLLSKAHIYHLLRDDIVVFEDILEQESEHLADEDLEEIENEESSDLLRHLKLMYDLDEDLFEEEFLLLSGCISDEKLLLKDWIMRDETSSDFAEYCAEEGIAGLEMFDLARQMGISF